MGPYFTVSLILFSRIMILFAFGNIWTPPTVAPGHEMSCSSEKLAF
jgi:hypothetical protein